ncbi:MAG: phospholipase C/P1 nuclease family protein [Acidobacteriaceae bacterium]
MRTFHRAIRLAAAVVLLPILAVPPSFAWGNEGHTDINRVAAEALPSDVPAFLRTPEAINAIAYLGPEPDRWRNPAEPELVSAQAPEHFIDLELADMIGPLPRKRFDFIRDLYAEAVKHPDKAKDLAPDHVGLQPYVTIEVYERLKAAMRAYRELSAAHKDTKPVELAITFYAGWLGHYVADGSQPLHTSIQYNGWVGPNPNGYTTDYKIHWQFEGVFVGNNIKAADFAPLVPKTPHVLRDPFADYMAYLRHSHTLVEKVYQLDKEGGFVGAGTPESRQFTEERLAAGATMLRDMIYTAWVRSADPVVDPFAPKPAAPKAASAH